MRAKKYRKHLEQLRQTKRKKYPPLVHQIHKEHNISKKTLFYIKEYGPHSHVSKTIIRESIRILLFASIISSFGGLILEHIRAVFISIIPLIIMLPALNDMIGNYGTIMSSKFSTLLHEGKIKGRWQTKQNFRKLFTQIFIIAIITSFFSSLIAMIISSYSYYSLDITIALKIFLISIIDTVLLISVLFSIAVFAGLYFYRKEEDPSNFLIPITTSVADFGNIVILSVLVLLLF